MSLESATEVRQMFESVASRYDLLNRLCSLGLDQGWRDRLVASLSPPAGSRLLDLASGSGDVARLLQARFPGCNVVGLDCAASMLAKAKEKMARTGAPASPQLAPVEFVQGWGEKLPFADASFAAVTCAFGIRNFRPPEGVLAEVYRVLEPGGWFSILEFAMPRKGAWRWVYRLYLMSVVPRVGRLLSCGPAYAYLDRSIREFLSPRQLCQIVAAAGFAPPARTMLAGGAVALICARKGGG